MYGSNLTRLSSLTNSSCKVCERLALPSFLLLLYWTSPAQAHVEAVSPNALFTRIRVRIHRVGRRFTPRVSPLKKQDSTPWVVTRKLAPLFALWRGATAANSKLVPLVSNSFSGCNGVRKAGRSRLCGKL